MSKLESDTAMYWPDHALCPPFFEIHRAGLPAVSSRANGATASEHDQTTKLDQFDVSFGRYPPTDRRKDATGNHRQALLFKAGLGPAI